MNFSVYLPQLGRVTNGYSHIKYVRTADHFHPQKHDANNYNRYYVANNTQQIAGGDFNTRFFARNDLNWTDIIEVPINDIQYFKNETAKGFKLTSSQVSANLEGIYRNGSRNSSTYFGWTVSDPCPYDGGKLNAIPTNSADTATDFYKGLDSSDCFQFLEELGLV